MTALDGLKVLDLTQFEAGPSCTQLLAWLGAQVVKIEPPGSGDTTRAYDEDWRDSLFFLNFNANKRSLALNLKSERGRDLFLQLVARFDVVVENFGPGTMERLGLGYDVLRAANPVIIYGSIKGFGSTGPYAGYKCFDMVAQAMAGVMSVTGTAEGPPIRPGATFGDTGTGLTLAVTLLAAYVQRLRTGEGQRIEVSMQEATANFMRMQLSQRAHYEGAVVPRQGNRSLMGGSPMDLFPCAPGGANDWVYVMIVGEHMWQALCGAVARPDLIDDERFCTLDLRRANADALYAEITAWTQQRDKFAAMEALGAAGIPAGAVLDTAELLADSHLVQRGMVAAAEHPERGVWDYLMPPWKMSASSVDFQVAPLLGQHSAEVLREELDLDAATLASLAASGVLHVAPASTPTG